MGARGGTIKEPCWLMMEADGLVHHCSTCRCRYVLTTYGTVQVLKSEDWILWGTILWPSDPKALEDEAKDTEKGSQKFGKGVKILFGRKNSWIL